MKKVISGFSILVSLLVLASCGGSAESDIVSVWKIDVSSIDLKLGDGFPEEMKAMVEGQKAEMTGNTEEMDGITIEFKEGGTFVVAKKGEKENQEGTWKIDGDKLVLTAEVDGKSNSIKINLDEVTSDKLSLSLTAEDVLAQVKEQMPEAMGAIPAEFDIDAMVTGTKLAISLKK